MQDQRYIHLIVGIRLGWLLVGVLYQSICERVEDIPFVHLIVGMGTDEKREANDKGHCRSEKSKKEKKEERRIATRLYVVRMQILSVALSRGPCTGTFGLV